MRQQERIAQYQQFYQTNNHKRNLGLLYWLTKGLFYAIASLFTPKTPALRTNHTDNATDKVNRHNKVWAIVIGTGLALYPIHNLWLTDLAKNDRGEVMLFLPQLGALIWIMGVFLYIIDRDNWSYFKDIRNWGDKKVVVPLLVIVAGIGLSGISVNGGVTDKIAPLFMGFALFALYLSSRRIGKDIFKPIVVGVVIGSLGIIVKQIVDFGPVTGGFIFERNFDIATGYILLGAALLVRNRWQWALAGLAVISLLLSGAPEAIFAMGLLFMVVLSRKDWSVRTTGVIVAVVIVIAAVGIATGHTNKLYSYLVDSIRQNPVANYVSPEGERINLSPLGIRAQVIRDALERITVFGDGYNVTAFRINTVHNVPLIIVQQLGWVGVIAGLAWLWIVFYCLMKTRWKYVWILIPVLSIFDHYIWTQIGPWFWVVAGASLSDISNTTDLIFRRTSK